MPALFVFSPIPAGILIGFVAQTLKGRTGAGWGFLTIVVAYAVFVFLFTVIGLTEPARLDDPAFVNAMFVMATVVASGSMLLIVATLPERGPAKAAEPAEKRRPCPHCAEQILPEARICRFCGREVEPVPSRSDSMEPIA